MSKDNKLIDTPPLTSTTPGAMSAKESLLVPSGGKSSEKRLSFKEGASIDEVVRNYTQNNTGQVNRRSLVPRQSVSMSPLKKEQLNEIKEGGNLNTEMK